MARLQLAYPSKSFKPLVVEKKDPGFIDFPDYIDSTNIAQEFIDKNQPLPLTLKQWLDERDFHRVTFNVKLGSLAKARGARRFVLETKLVGGEGPTAVQIDDIGPKTEWVAGGLSGEGSVGIDYDFLGGLLKFVRLPLPIPEINAKFEYKWNPKVAKVIAGASGGEADWIISHADRQYLDGSHQLEILIRRPRPTKSLKLTIQKAWIHYDVPWAADVAFSEEALEIPVNFTESGRN